MDFIEDIKIDDMPNSDMEMVAETCGLKAAVALMQEFGGTQLNIPKFWHKKLVERKIVEEFNGSNIAAITKKYGVSKTFVYKTVSERLKSPRNK